MKELTYTDKSVSYQISRLRKQLRFVHGGGADYVLRRIEQLKREQHVCLLEDGPNGEVYAPSGLVDRISEKFGAEIVDERKRPRSTPGYYVQGRQPTLRPYQEEQLAACLAAGQGTIVSATGTGKTVVIQRLVQRLGLKALIVVPSIPILEQTVDRFEDYFGKAKVGQFGGGKKRIKAVTVACGPSILTSKPEDWEEIDVLIFDECHHLPCSTVSAICYDYVPNAYYRFGFTATPFRADGADLAIEAAAFRPIHTYTIQQGIADGFLAKPRFVVFGLKRSGGRRHSSHVRSFQEHVIQNEELNRLAIGQIKACLAKGKQVVALVKEKEHGHSLYNQIPGATFVRAKGEKSKEDQAPWIDPSTAVKEFNAGKLRCLIGTSVIGEGTDLKPVDVLVMLAGGASKGLVLQNLGRGLRKVDGRKDSVLVIDYVVDADKAEQLKRHAEMRIDLYREIGPVDVMQK